MEPQNSERTLVRWSQPPLGQTGARSSCSSSSSTRHASDTVTFMLARTKMGRWLWKTLWSFLKVLNVELPYDSAITLLCICPRELKHIHIKTGTGMVIVAVFIIVKRWE